MATSETVRAPAVTGLALLRQIPELARFAPGALARMAIESRGVVRVGAGRGGIYLVAEPDDVGRVLVENNRNYWKGRVFNRASFAFGRGLVLNEGDSWLHQRRLMSPAFSHARVAGLVPLMAGVMERKRAAWEAAARQGRPVEMVREMMSVTMGVIARTMFSLSVTDGDVDTLARAFHALLRHMSLRFNTFFLPERVPLPGAREARAALDVLEGMIRRVVAERRAGGERPDDLLQMLLEARDENGEGMSDRQLRDEVLTTLFGGYEATADSLAWTWHLLARHPQADARFRDEVDRVVSSDVPTLEELGRLDFTRRLLQESARVLPPFWWILRAAHGDDVLGGRRVPAGATVLVLLYATHRHPDHWEDPERFDPGRFLPEAVAARHRHAYIPFGAGQRACIGRHLALLEMPLVLAMAARDFRPVPVSPGPVPIKAGASLRAQGGIWMRLERARTPAAV